MPPKLTGVWVLSQIPVVIRPYVHNINNLLLLNSCSLYFSRCSKTVVNRTWNLTFIWALDYTLLFLWAHYAFVLAPGDTTYTCSKRAVPVFWLSIPPAIFTLPIHRPLAFCAHLFTVWNFYLFSPHVWRSSPSGLQATSSFSSIVIFTEDVGDG